MAAEWKKYTPAERIRNTVALAGDVEKVEIIRREARFVVSSGGRFNTFLKTKGLEPACFEGVVAALLACGKLSER